MSDRGKYVDGKRLRMFQFLCPTRCKLEKQTRRRQTLLNFRQINVESFDIGAIQSYPSEQRDSKLETATRKPAPVFTEFVEQKKKKNESMEAAHRAIRVVLPRIHETKFSLSLSGWRCQKTKCRSQTRTISARSGEDLSEFNDCRCR